MTLRNKLHYQNRIEFLRAKGEVENDALIKKCMRKIRQLENKADT